MIVFIRKYTIPDGRDIWMIDNLGNVVDYIECDDYDCIHIVDGVGNILSSSNYYEPGTISELCLDGQSNTSFSVCGFQSYVWMVRAIPLFLFVDLIMLKKYLNFLQVNIRIVTACP